MSQPFKFSGDAALEPAVARALHRVVDPEVAIDIVELGLVYAVAAEADRVHVRATMTSAACPVADLIVEDIERELCAELGDSLQVVVELVWDPPWSPERMSDAAREALGG